MTQHRVLWVKTISDRARVLPGWRSTWRDSTSEEEDRDRTHHQMLGSFPKAKAKNSRNEETKNRQSLDNSKFKNQNSIWINIGLKGTWRKTAFLSDPMASPTNKQINMCKVIGSPPVQDRPHSVKMHGHTEHARVQPGQADTPFSLPHTSCSGLRP